MLCDTRKTWDISQYGEWVSTEKAALILGISSRQVHRDKDYLLLINCPKFEYYGRGYNQQSFRILREFRRLCNERGRKEARLKILEELTKIEDLNNE